MEGFPLRDAQSSNSSFPETTDRLPEWLNEKKQPLVTTALIVINVLFFAAMCLGTGGAAIVSPSNKILLDWGADYGPLTMDFQYFRLLTDSVVHVGIVHLLLNMYVLWYLGPIVERLFGCSKFALIYLLSAIGGSLASLLFDPLLLSAGASGAIFGIYGALLAFFASHRKQLPPSFLRRYSLTVAFLVLYNLFYGLIEPGIDNSAHIGGFVTGFLSGMCLVPSTPGCLSWRHRQATGALSMVVFLSIFGFVDAARFVGCGYPVYQDGLDELRAGKFESAIEHLDRFIALNPRLAHAYEFRAEAHYKLGNRTKALSDFSSCIDLDCHNPIPYNGRAWTYDSLRLYQEAIHDSNHSLWLDPKSGATYDTRGFAYARLRRQDEALKDFARAIKLDPKGGAPYYHRAQLYEQMGCLTQSRNDFRSAASLGYKPEPWELD